MSGGGKSRWLLLALCFVGSGLPCVPFLGVLGWPPLMSPACCGGPSWSGHNPFVGLVLAFMCSLWPLLDKKWSNFLWFEAAWSNRLPSTRIQELIARFFLASDHAVAGGGLKDRVNNKKINNKVKNRLIRRKIKNWILLNNYKKLKKSSENHKNIWTK